MKYLLIGDKVIRNLYPIGISDEIKNTYNQYLNLYWKITNQMLYMKNYLQLSNKITISLL